MFSKTAERAGGLAPAPATLPSFTAATLAPTEPRPSPAPIAVARPKPAASVLSSDLTIQGNVLRAAISRSRASSRATSAPTR